MSPLVHQTIYLSLPLSIFTSLFHEVWVTKNCLVDQQNNCSCAQAALTQWRWYSSHIIISVLAGETLHAPTPTCLRRMLSPVLDVCSYSFTLRVCPCLVLAWQMKLDTYSCEVQQYILYVAHCRYYLNWKDTGIKVESLFLKGHTNIPFILSLK